MKQLQLFQQTSTREESFKVAYAARLFGGSFFKALFGDALPLADEHNMEKMKRAWPDKWAQYLEMYDRAKQVD